MSSEEWHIHTGLVHTYPHLLRWCANEAWNVSTTKDVTSNAILHDHFYGTINFSIFGEVVSSPVSSELLGSKEVRACKNKRSTSCIITSNKTSVTLSLLGGTIGVMELTMLNFLSICANVLSGSGNSLADFREDARLIHVVPGVVDFG